jgi:hypothetical protein
LAAAHGSATRPLAGFPLTPRYVTTVAPRGPAIASCHERISLDGCDGDTLYSFANR